MTHKEILEQTKSELDRLVSEAKRKLDNLVKPELEVGKWYKFDAPLFEYLLKYDGSDTAYGFADDTWSSSWSFSKNANQELAKGKEATEQEVEDALVKEAKRRGIVEGSDIKSVDGYVFKNILGSYIFGNSMLCFGGAVIFKDGKWATIIEKPVDKFAELKEAHKNGAVIQFKSKLDGSWQDTDMNESHWHTSYEYRIKPEENRSTLDQDIKALKEKYPNLKFTITVEDNL